MTIAACYVSKEGVLLGADSTSTYASLTGDFRFYNNAQKVLEIGESGSSLGMATWGLGELPNASYRTLAAYLSDELIAKEPANVQEVSERWAHLFWSAYHSQLAGPIYRFQQLDSMPKRSEGEDNERVRLWQQLVAGFCIAGRVHKDRTPHAFELLFTPRLDQPPAAAQIRRNAHAFWGCPNLINSVLDGISEQVRGAILASPHWTGGQDGLNAVVDQFGLRMNCELPLREAIDWIYSVIFITIKGMKFSRSPMFCGGSIEIAAITADRPFRWVCHKGLDQALSDHFPKGMG